jgi:hypothetical protein
MPKEFIIDRTISNKDNVLASDGTLIQFTDRNTLKKIIVEDETTEDVIHAIKVHYFMHSITGTTGITDIMMKLGDQEGQLIPDGVRLKNIKGDRIFFYLIPKDKEVEENERHNLYKGIKGFITFLSEIVANEPLDNEHICILKEAINKYFNYLN